VIVFLAPIPPVDEQLERNDRALLRSRLCWLVLACAVAVVLVLLATAGLSDATIEGTP
jgi:hypothetical protein